MQRKIEAFSKNAILVTKAVVFLFLIVYANHAEAQTIANLLPNGANIKWYATAASGTSLPSNTVLVDGTHYYASQTINGSESTARLDVIAHVYPLPTPTFIAQPGATALTNTDVTYTTESSKSDYVWTYSGTLNTDYAIISGGGNTNSVTLKWLTNGSKTVTINYTTNGCTAASATSSTPTTISMIPPGNAMAFDGSNDFVDVGNGASVQLTQGTLEAWIKTSGSGTYSSIIIKQWAYGLFLHSNVLEIYDWSGGGFKSTGVNLADSRWHHVAFSFNSGVTNGSFVYLDGVLKLTTTFTVYHQEVNLGIGAIVNGPDQLFTGTMDEVRVWNTMRTQAEIQSAMYTELTGTESGLLVNFNFNQGIASGDNTGIITLFDKTSNANNGTLTNFSKTGSTSNFVESYAMAVPVPAAATSLTGTGFTANWNAPVTGTVSSFILDVSTNSTFSPNVTGYDGLNCGTSLSQVVTGLTANTTYYYRVRADKTSVTGSGGYYRTPVTVTTLTSPTLAATTAVTSITATTAGSGGNITSDGGASVTARGVCWNTSTGPTTANSKTTDGTGSGTFSSALSGLTASTTYYVRAYATSSVGTSYGAEVSFTTSLPSGMTSSDPGTSAYQIKQDYPGSADGIYWIDLPNVGPTQVYCIMNSICDGGGWMLALKATTGTTFNYSATYWTTSNTLNPTDNTRNNADAKYATMNNFQAKDIMALWPDIPSNYNSSATGGCINLSATYNNWCWLQNNFNGGTRTTLINFFSTANNLFFSDAALWAGKGTAFSGQTDVRFYGFNYAGNSVSKTRWGFGWNENGGGLYPNGDQGSNDVSGGIGMDSGFGSYSAGDKNNCCSNFSGINRSARVEVYIR